MKEKKSVSHITIRFAGDSGDGIQLAGSQLVDTSALMGNDFSTFPDYPAEIRAPAGSLPGVSSFQLQLSDSIIHTPGDAVDVLVALNPAALKVNLKHLKKGSLIITNINAFTPQDLSRAACKVSPLEDGSLKDYTVMQVPLTDLTENALKGRNLTPGEIDRCKNFLALGITYWLFDRDPRHTEEWIRKKFSAREEIVKANVDSLLAGMYYAETIEALPVQTPIKKAQLPAGTYRKVTGSEAMAIGLVAAGEQANKTLIYATYPITPASDILHELAQLKDFGAKTIQCEDEIAAVCAAVGASFGGALGVTGTSGPGLCLKSEGINLAVMAELPIVVIDVQRAGPSTGMPTKSEQTDLWQALYGRSGESPLIVLSAKSPSDCFAMAFEAVRLAVKYMTPVILLTDGTLANSAEPWKLPDIENLPKITTVHPTAGPERFMPYARDPNTLARPWALPGTKGLEHRIGGLEKTDITGMVSYDPDNHERMVKLRAEKVARTAADVPALEVFGPQSGDLLVLSWGSTYGAVRQAVTDLAEDDKFMISHAHLNYINPLPKNMVDVFSRFKTVLVPELNLGQLRQYLQGLFPQVRFTGYDRVKGVPFRVDELKEVFRGAR